MVFDRSKLPPLREVVAQHGINASKALGQNFLFDLNITDKIVRGAAIAPEVNVIEIGPGPGGLTRSLLSGAAASVTVVEKDERCIAALEQLQSLSTGRLTIVNGDALEADITTLCDAPRAIVANLPYNIATELLVGWLDAIYSNPQAIQSMTLMFQKEVADRIISAPSCKAYGRISILAQWLCKAQRLFDLPPSAFSPAPKVTSTVLHFIPRDRPLAPANKALLEKVVQDAALFP